MCIACLDELPWLARQQCLHCALPLPTGRPDLRQACNAAAGVRTGHCALGIRFPVDTLISRFKHNRQMAFGPADGRTAGAVLALACIELTEGLPRPASACIPRQARLRERGFNQAGMLGDGLATSEDADERLLLRTR